MTREEAQQAWEKMRSEIDETNWLFVGTINPQMVDIAIEALKATKGWIPCSEKLPSKRQSVLISTSECFVGEGCYWETTEHHVIWKGYRWNATYWDDEVVAWMPLPTPYKGGERSEK